MKKLIAILACVVALCAVLTACNQQETFDYKPITGINAAFDEELGFGNESPAAFRTKPTEQYVYYTRNTKAFDALTDSIAVRKADYHGGKWNYGAFKTLLEPVEGSWDSRHVAEPDVVKGAFKYQGEDYSYLMAYVGSSSINRLNGQIGLAVAKSPMGPFVRVGTEPLLPFDKTQESDTGITDFKGNREPALVSYDKQGKVRLMWSFYGKFNGSYCIELDCSNLDAIAKGGRMLVNTAGLSDESVRTVLYSADWAYDPDFDEYVVCRNFSSATTGLPSVAAAVQMVRAPEAVVYTVDTDRPETEGAFRTWWTLCNEAQMRIGAVQTADDFSDDDTKWNGYSRVYAGTIVTDEYGWVLENDGADLLLTSSATDETEGLEENEYLFSQMIHEFRVEINRE